MNSWKALAAGVLLFVPAHRIAAQQAVTVSGHVTAEGGPVPNAHVRILSLKIDRVTDTDGYYSFIVQSSSVRGQTVRMSVVVSDRRVHYAPSSADVKLEGLPISKDFDLKVTSGERPPIEAEPSEGGRRGGSQAGANGQSTDTLMLGDLAGAVDLPSALVGRFAGLSVLTPNVLGGSPSAIYRGPRSVLGTSQPLVVLDGIPLDNTSFSSSAQRFGQGGFDYGSTLGDLDLSTIASVQFLTGPQAAARFGGRAANGVLVITSKDGVDGPGFAISAGQQITSETPGRLPVFQNQYGQGLDGKFQFFDGKGAGVNDAVDQNWGPLLDGRPLAQASLTESGLADVRLWTAHPS
ncbi:MAG: TonB-dependent receptor plug domain-containing protein, partial [Gemmatimonadaceae bacterium]